ncbi:hypothetical protein N7530_007873 [Penicillium desertorum]|uniref:Zn(2)-C6 fungal-type domain-containing protein n=1 Tax=Penicillium desertorum TaxID=1303715 RepID=A0A9W9WN65_9EURO|nr:hypothetical protein N7530_007873 [Penicillium desertorum]
MNDQMNDNVLRAIRCDKQLHCANCADAGVKCSRTRAQRPRRQSSYICTRRKIVNLGKDSFKV